MFRGAIFGLIVGIITPYKLVYKAFGIDFMPFLIF